MTPTVGRIVHYTTEKNQLRPAIVVAVTDESYCTLQVFTAGTEDGDEFGGALTDLVKRVAFAESPKERHWSWPVQAAKKRARRGSDGG